MPEATTCITARTRSGLEHLGQCFSNLPVAWQVAAVSVILVLKAGWSLAPGMGSPLVEAMVSFPHPGGVCSEQYR